jgi:hypothetical protein
MATFAELKCFNKLLLEKMKRQQEQLKELKRLQHIEEKYESLDWAISGSVDYPPHCGLCDLYIKDDEFNWVSELGQYCCFDCGYKNGLYECEECGCVYFEVSTENWEGIKVEDMMDEGEEDLLVIAKIKKKDGDVICLHCYKQEIKNNYKKVMDQLKKEAWECKGYFKWHPVEYGGGDVEAQMRIIF